VLPVRLRQEFLRRPDSSPATNTFGRQRHATPHSESGDSHCASVNCSRSLHPFALAFSAQPFSVRPLAFEKSNGPGNSVAAPPPFQKFFIFCRHLQNIHNFASPADPSIRLYFQFIIVGSFDPVFRTTALRTITNDVGTPTYSAILDPHFVRYAISTR